MTSVRYTLHNPGVHSRRAGSLVLDDRQAEVYVLKQTAPRQFAPRRRLIDLPLTLISCVVEDIDGDGDFDLVGLTSARTLEWYSTNGGTVFTFEQTLASGLSSAGVRSLRSFDLDGSDTRDFVWLNPQSRLVQACQGLTGGTFGPTLTLTQTGGVGRVITVRRRVGTGPPDIIVGTIRPNAPGGDRIERFAGLTGLSYAPLETVTFNVDEPISLELADIDGDGDQDLVTGSRRDKRLAWHRGTTSVPVGTSFCGPAAPNSTGRPGRLFAVGSAALVENALRLEARDLTPNAGMLFLTSLTQDFVPGAGGSDGNLCLGADVGRFLRAGQAGRTDADGARRLTLDLFKLPQPAGLFSASVGQRWSFQAWHRDVRNGVPVSNFSMGVAVTLR